MAYKYFAYGSCMNTKDLLRTTPSARNPQSLVLPNWELKFDIYAPGRKGGVANIVPGDSEVEGILWTVDELDTLRLRECCSYVYQETIIDTPLGPAVTFISNWRNPEQYQPHTDYLHLLLNPAVPHSEQYREHILTFTQITQQQPVQPHWKLTYQNPVEEHHFHNPLEALELASHYPHRNPQLIHAPTNTLYPTV